MAVGDPSSSQTQPFLLAKHTGSFEIDEEGHEEIMMPPLGAHNDTSTTRMDAAWGVAFKINVAFTCLCALYFGRTGLEVMANNNEAWTSGGLHFGSGFGGSSLLFPLIAGAGIVGVAWVFAWGVLRALIHAPKQILQASYLGFAGMLCVTALSAVAQGYFLAAAFPGIVGAFVVRFFFKNQSRFHFGGATLKVAALAIRSMPSVVNAALLVSGFQVLWATVCGVAAAGSTLAFQSVQDPDSGSSYSAVDCLTMSSSVGGTKTLSCNCNSGEYVSSNGSGCGALYSGGLGTTLLSIFWMASLTWGGMVLQSVVSATVAGSVASWWFSPSDPAPARGAFYRATHGSFGSVCKAAAITSSVMLFRSAVSRAGRVGRWLNEVVLGWAQLAVDYVLAYTIAFIGIYGFDFGQAGDRVSKLFQRRGVTALANDTVVDVGLTMLAMALTLGYMYALYLLVWLLIALAVVMRFGGIVLIFLLFAGVFGYLACGLVIATTLEVVRSGFKTVFVCFVQDPEALARNHGPRLHSELSNAWEEINKVLSVEDVTHDGSQG